MSIDESYEYKELRANGFIPRNSFLMNNKSLHDKCIRVSDFLKLSTEERIATSKRVIGDDAVWFAISDTRTFSSNNKDRYYVTSKENRMITSYKISKNEDGSLVGLPVEPISLIKMSDTIKKKVSYIDLIKSGIESEQKGGIKMANNDLEQLLANAKAAAAEGATASTSLQGGNSKKEDAKAIHNRIEGDITASIQGIKIGNSVGVTSFNKQLGRLVGYVVRSDKKIVAYTPSKPTLLNGEIQLKPGVSQQVADEFARTHKAKQSDILKHKELAFKEAAPSTVLGMVITVPQGGLISGEKMLNGNAIEFDANKKDLVTLVQSKDNSLYTIMRLFGGSIKESELTFGAAASELAVTVTSSWDAVNKKTVAKIRTHVANRKKAIINGSYIPAKVYKTIPYSEIVASGDEVKNKINKAVFGAIFKPNKNNERKYDALDEASKAKIELNDGVYSSTVFAKGGNLPAIKAFDSDEVEISSPAFPVKDFKVNGKGSESASYVTYDVVGKNAEDLEYLNPENDPRFANFKKALGGMTIKEAIEKVAAKKKKASKTSKTITLDNNQALALLTSRAQGSTAKVDFNFKIDKDTINKVDETINSNITY